MWHTVMPEQLLFTVRIKGIIKALTPDDNAVS